MAFRPRGNVIQQVAWQPTQSNFNDYVKYARGAMNAGGAPNAAGFQQYMGQTYGAAPPGGMKDQQQPAPPASVMPEVGQLNRIPMQQGAAPIPSMPPKGGRNLQYAAALSRMK